MTPASAFLAALPAPLEIGPRSSPGAVIHAVFARYEAEVIAAIAGGKARVALPGIDGELVIFRAVRLDLVHEVTAQIVHSRAELRGSWRGASIPLLTRRLL